MVRVLDSTCSYYIMRLPLIWKIILFKYTSVLRDHLRSFKSRSRDRHDLLWQKYLGDRLKISSTSRGVVYDCKILFYSLHFRRVAYREEGAGMSKPRLWQGQTPKYKVLRLLSISSIQYHRKAQHFPTNHSLIKSQSYPSSKFFCHSSQRPLVQYVSPNRHSILLADWPSI